MFRQAFLIATVLLAICPTLRSQDTYENPIIRYSLPDPTVMRDDDGTYWLYATEDTHNVPIWYSSDLVHWTFSGTAFTNKTRPNIVSGGGIWAPHISKIGGKYLLYYSMSVWGGTWTCGIGVATSDHPYGPFTDAHTLFTSKDINVENSIDPFVWSEDGHNYMFWGSFHDIYVIELTEDGLQLKEGATKTKVGGGLTEGTTIFKKGDYYYLIGSAGSCCEGAKSTYRLVVARSKSLFGPYLDRNGKKAYDNNYSALLNGNKKVAGPGHCSSIVQDDAGNDWLIYHGYLADDPDRGRLTFLDAIVWKSNWPTVYRSQPSASADVPWFSTSEAATPRSDMFIADPFILTAGDTYYAYGTSFRSRLADGIDCYTSTDLINWRHASLALDSKNAPGPLGSDSLPTRIAAYSEPKVYAFNDRYYMYYTADGHTCVATADDPRGPFVQQGEYLTRQLLKKEVTYQPAMAVDEDGRYLLVRRDGSGAGIWSMKLSDDGLSVSRPLRKLIGAPTEKNGSSDDWELLSGKTLQSPFVVPCADGYVMLYTANDTASALRGIGTASASKISLTWRKNKANPVLLRTIDLAGVGGGSLFTDLEGRTRMVFHAWYSVSTHQPRSMYIAEVAFEGDTLRLTDAPLILPRYETTAIRPPFVEPTSGAPAYDLQGRPLAQPQTGIVIREGKKQLEK